MKQVRIAVNVVAAGLLLLVACHKEPALIPSGKSGNVKQTDGLGFFLVPEWVQAASLPRSGRSLAFAFNIGSKGYIGGGDLGISPDNLSTGDLWQYDPTTNAWTQEASLPVALENAASFVCGTQGYVCGGYHYGWDGKYYVNNLFQYDPASNTWNIKADFPGGARTAATGINIGNEGYVGLGNLPNYAYANDWWQYDPLADRWAQVTSFPGGARSCASGFSVGREGYVTCGVGYNLCYNDLWGYSPIYGTWTREADLPGLPRMSAAGFNYGNYGAIATGVYVNLIAPDSNLNDFWYYNPSNNQWTQSVHFGGIPRNAAVGFSINGTPYVGTGFNYAQGGNLNDFWYQTWILIP